MAIGIHASWLTHQHNDLDLDSTYKGAYGLPLLRMTFDWHGNDPRMMRNMNKRRGAVRWPGNLRIATRFPHGKGRHHT
jgi:gluconate 2-dehydrogenase alpha chain